MKISKTSSRFQHLPAKNNIHIKVNAARVKRLGTSRTIDRSSYTAGQVAKELQELLENPNYATKAAEIGRIIQMENGVKVACDAIEDRLKKTIFS